MKNTRYLISLILAVILVISPVLERAADASWQGVSSWQEMQLGSPDTFLHLIVGDAIGAMVQTNFKDDDRRTQYIKALLISLSIGLLKEAYDMSNQNRYNKPLNLPDSIKDLAMDVLGVLISFNFDLGSPVNKKDNIMPHAQKDTVFSLSGTPESVSLRTDSLSALPPAPEPYPPASEKSLTY